MERIPEQEELFNPIEISTIPDIFAIPATTMADLERSLEWLENYHAECEREKKKR